MSDARTLYLIDASSIIHRAFHALPNLSSTKGQPTGAILGFARMLLKVINQGRPDLIGVVFDSKGPTFRHEIDPQYKANRPPADPDLIAQFEPIRRLTAALGLTCLEQPGFEADDIIATLSRRAEATGMKVVIVSGDKDLMQLLGPQVEMWDTMQDKHLGPDQVLEKYGVPPEKLADAFGLIGDTSDNIPGVPGIGPKIAGQLINEYGDLETLLARAGEIKQNKRRQNLQEFADQARMSKELASLAEDMDLDLTPEDLAPAQAREAELTKLLTGWEMNSLLAELAPGEDGGGEAESLPEVEALDPGPELEAFLAQVKKVGRLALAVDYESGRPLIGGLTGLGLAVEDRAVELNQTDLPAVAPLLKDASIAKTAFNLKADRLALGHAGAGLEGLAFDIFIADYLLYPGRRSLTPEILVREHLSVDLGLNNALNRPGLRAAAAWRLEEVLSPKLTELEVASVMTDIEMPLVPVLADMEARGVALDLEELGRQSEELAGRLEKLTAQIYEAAETEFNINSPKQLGEILFDHLGLPQGKKTAKKTGYSTGVAVLEDLRHLHPLPGLILDYRQLAKLKSTYLDALADLVDPADGRIHTTFNQTVAATGRLSSSDPNLQNIPIRTAEGRRIRKAFIAGDGMNLLSADYSQIELRLLAHYTEDPALVRAFQNDEDIHTQTAALVFDLMPGFVDAEMRRQAKAINFGLIYGKTPYGLALDLKIPTATAEKFINNYFARFAKVKDFMDQALIKARERGWVATMWGRKRFIPDLNHSNHMQRKNGERMAINTIFQGSAADLIKRAMINLDKELAHGKLPARMLLQVHDELVLEVEQGAEDKVGKLVQKVMEGAADLKVPLKVDWGVAKDWLGAH